MAARAPLARGRVERARASCVPLAVGLSGGAAVTAVLLRDPHVPGSWGACPVLALTGVPCPGCGGLRAVHDLASGQVLAALGSNALAVALVVTAVGLWTAWWRARWRGRPLRLAERVGNRTTAAVVAVLVLFTVLRWLPGGEVLGP